MCFSPESLATNQGSTRPLVYVYAMVVGKSPQSHTWKWKCPRAKHPRFSDRLSGAALALSLCAPAFEAPGGEDGERYGRQGNYERQHDEAESG